MPTAQPREAIEAIEEPLLRAYSQAWQRVVEEQQAIALEPLKWRRKARLVEIQRSIEHEMEALDEQAARWVAEQFPRAYGMGAAAGAADIGASQVVWTSIQQEAVESLAKDLFDDLLSATKGVNDSTRRLVRAIAKDEVLQKAIAGDTAKAAGRRMARILQERGIHAVTYSNGARHGLAEYSQVVVRTKTAVAYNEGVLSGAPEVGFFEVFDGAGCGWTGHDDPMEANGRVVTRDEASAHPISHPNCRRAFGGRPDLDPPVNARNERRLQEEIARPAWRPTMTRTEADAYVSGTALPGPRFHGTRRPDRLKAEGFSAEQIGTATGQISTGFYLTSAPEYARAYAAGKNPLEARILAERPMEGQDLFDWVASTGGYGTPGFAAKVAEFVHERGFDSVHVTSINGNKLPVDEIMVFDPKQVVFVED